MQPVDRRLVMLRDSLVGQVLRGSGGTSYYLRDQIGEGGQGWVFKANWDEPGGIVVIVKVLRPDAVQPDSLPRFRREAEVLRLLSQQPHPNPYIVRFYDHAVAQVRGRTGDNVSLPFTVLEYVAGPTLERVLAQHRGRGMGVERARRLARQAVHALELVHSQEVVHRDLKPSNILIATEGGAEVAKLTDFGIVKRADMNLQRTTTLAGASLGYAPPEQYEQGNDRVTPKTDIFSLAAILFEMLSGEMAFPFSERENPLLIVTRILNGPRPELSRLRDQLSPELAARPDLVKELDVHIGRALSADPNDRQASISELWGKVEPLLREIGTAAADAPASMLPFASTETSRERADGAPAAVRSTQRSSQAAQPVAPAVRVNPVIVSPAPASPAPRPRALEPAANPAAWTWRVVSRSVQEKLLATASFSPAGDTAIAVGPGGLARWTRGAWTSLPPPASIDPRAIRAIKVLPEGDLVLLGEQGLAARVSARGGHEVWGPLPRHVTLRGVSLHRDTAVVVGESRGKQGTGEPVGFAAQVSGGRLGFAFDVPSATRLHGVARLDAGAVIAVGDRGALVRLDRGQAEAHEPICRGHLVAVEPVKDGGAVTVGGGGHALYLSPHLGARLEAVQTTRDLCALAIGADGAAWAGAAQARLLRREVDSWVRMSGDLGIVPRIVAIWPGDAFVRAVCDDGAVLEGRAA